jgi:hypothetical protein
MNTSGLTTLNAVAAALLSLIAIAIQAGSASDNERAMTHASRILIVGAAVGVLEIPTRHSRTTGETDD